MNKDNDFTAEFISAIKDFLKGSRKLTVLGVGNPDNGDDGVGLYVIELLKKEHLPDWVELINCERVPEHFLGKLEKMKPNRIIVVDAANMHEVPGAIAIFPQEMISQGYNFSTHTLSLTMLNDFLKETIADLKVLYIGLQPKQTVFETNISKECKIAAEELAKVISDLIKNR